MYILEEILKERLKYGITNIYVIESYLLKYYNIRRLLLSNKSLFFYTNKRTAQAYIVYGPKSYWRFGITYDIHLCWSKFNEDFTEERITIDTINKFIYQI